MAKRFREVIESIVFAGMKPGAPAAKRQRFRWLGPFRRPVERFLSGGPAPSDPLYLSNRTIGQRIRFALVMAAPCVMVAALMALSLGSYFVRKKPAPKREPTPAELAARMLPDMSNVKIETNRDVDVMEVHIDRSGAAALTGTVRNNTNHEIRTAEIVFDLTDSSGSQLGGVSQRLENLVPQKSLNFRLPIDQQDARFVLVREVRTR